MKKGNVRDGLIRLFFLCENKAAHMGGICLGGADSLLAQNDQIILNHISLKNLLTNYILRITMYHAKRCITQKEV